jgi:hypothetical protein
VLLFLSRVGALAISLSLSSDALAKGRFFINQTPIIKRQDANYQSIRHPGLLSNSFRSINLISFVYAY